MPHGPTAAEIDHAARLLRAGRLVAFPTETVYGLAANALDAEAVARIYAVKRRPPTSPLIVHVDSFAMAQSLVSAWPEDAGLLARKFWPGPLTLVLPIVHVGADAPVRPADQSSAVLSSARSTSRVGTGASPVQAKRSSAEAGPAIIPSIVTAGLPSVGLRMPAHPVALALIRAAGVPLAAPSANRFTELSPTTAEHVRRSLGDDVDMILDGGPCTVGIESTVLSLVEPQPVLLRPGGISRHEIESLIGPIAMASDPVAGSHPAPGMHARHYSPRTSLFLISNGELPEQGRGIYLQHTQSPNRAAAVRHMPQSAHDYAAALYRQLHEADEGHFDWIAVDLPPITPEWEAVHDRLLRAASAS